MGAVRIYDLNEPLLLAAAGAVAGAAAGADARAAAGTVGGS